ncbi:MAG: M48 family metallopeptidase [Saprospiraceae bacterium]
MKKYKINKNLKIDDFIIPTEIIKEFRFDTRYSITKSKLIIRIPLYYNNMQTENNIDKAKKWASSILLSDKEKYLRFIPKKYHSGQILEINGKKFKLNLREGDFKSFSAKLINEEIFIYIPYNSEASETNNAIVNLQSKIIAKVFKTEITNRIEEINKKYFDVKIENIRLKHNKSNWGSRSSKNNINISTRLLFAPKDVQDYVFIHELAHFLEMNHSKAFWSIVESIDPKYKEKEQWLKLNSEKCNF